MILATNLGLALETGRRPTGRVLSSGIWFVADVNVAGEVWNDRGSCVCVDSKASLRHPGLDKSIGQSDPKS